MSVLVPEIAPRPGEWSAAKRRLLEQRLNGARPGATRAPAIPRHGGGDVTPLSFAQQRLWFFHQLEPRSPLYNMPLAARLRGRLDQPALQQAIDTIVQRHDVLRTRYEARDGDPVQIVGPAAATAIPVVDLAGAADPEAELERQLRAEAEIPFDLTRDPMLRVRLWRLNAEDHALLLTTHHIAGDGWSWAVMINELSTLYRDFLAGRGSSLPDLPIQYADYAVWQRAWLQGGTEERQIEYWKKQLEGAPHFLELPADRPRPPVQTFRGETATLVLPPRTSRALHELARRENATLFMTLLASYLTLLHRYTRQTDLLVGTPIAGRTQRETEPLIGFFINTLVLRGNLAGDPTFLELLGRIRETTLGAFSHQDLPFEKLVEELAPERSPSRSPLIQAMFALQNTPASSWQLPGLTATAIERETATSKFDLTLVATESGSGLVASLEYNLDLFDAATAHRMLRHWSELLDGIVADPGRRLSALPLMGTTERHQVLADWNRTETPFPDATTAAALFEEQARRTPHAVALAVEGGEDVTFAQLQARSDRIARHLCARGVGPESLVGIFLDRGPQMVAALLGAWKAGGAYLPLDPGYPAERLAFMLRDSGAKVVLAARRLIERLPATEAAVVDLDALLDPGATVEEASPAAAGPRNLAYVIYTSGSSGVPKGVAIEHRSLCNFIAWHQRAYRVGPADRVTQLASPSFDASVWELWPNLTAGASVHFPDEETRLAPGPLLRWMARHRITLAFVPTPLLEAALAEPWPSDLALRAVLTGGAQLHRRPPPGHPARIVNHYGPTEGTVLATCATVEPTGADARLPAIGRPVANAEAYVLDAQLQPVPVGVAGELFIGGAGVARGYLNRAQLTAERFLPHPFDDNPEARVYRTGDLVRWRSDGQLEFLGRLDQQVKIRGVRIELDEIETVLGQHPAVKACAVVAPADARGERRLAACVVPVTQPPPAPEEIRRFLQRKLPEFMVPSILVFRSALPLDPNGKVDRRALAGPEWTQTDPDRSTVAPRDAVERSLVGIWEEILDVRPVGVTDKFFELGGHSLLAVRLLALIEKKFGRKLPLASVFQAPTIEEFAAILRGQGAATLDSSIVEIRGHGSRPPLFLVHGAGGGMFWGYSNLSRHLGGDQPLYGIKSRGLDGKEEFETIREMAAHYVADLRAFQREGPYYLGGYCFGGNVAYEMACQLRAQGAEVGLLVLLNCAPANGSYGRVRPTPAWLVKYLCNLARMVSIFVRSKPATQGDYLRWRWNMIRKSFASAWRRPAGGTGLEIEKIIDLTACGDEQRRLWGTHIRALSQHRTSTFDGRVVLVRTRVHQRYCTFDPHLGWDEFVPGGVELRTLSGAHESILEEPQVENLGRELRACLAAAQGRAGA